MSRIGTLGDLSAASGDAYGAYQGGLSSPANQASFGAATATAIATGLQAAKAAPFLQGLSTNIAPGAGTAAVSFNVVAFSKRHHTCTKKTGARQPRLVSDRAYRLCRWHGVVDGRCPNPVVRRHAE